MAPFAMFGNLGKAFDCHAHLFLDHQLYAAVKAAALARPVNLEAFAASLGPKTGAGDTEHCGYSTNPNYAEELMALVRAHDLDKPEALLALLGPGLGAPGSGPGTANG
jgi:flagellum-specific peptidoglycan hydrolase FlgJ